MEIIFERPPATVFSSAPDYISVGAFFDRFGEQKIAVLSNSDATVQACIKDATVRQYIDLSRTDLPAMLDLIIASGHAISKSAVLSLVISDSERP